MMRLTWWEGNVWHILVFNFAFKIRMKNTIGSTCCLRASESKFQRNRLNFCYSISWMDSFRNWLRKSFTLDRHIGG